MRLFYAITFYEETKEKLLQWKTDLWTIRRDKNINLRLEKKFLLYRF